MPELPEVETVRRSLLPYLPGRRIERFEIRDPFVLVRPSAEEFQRELQGATFERLERHGKQLIFHLQAQQPLALLIHLGMTGQLTFRDPQRSDVPFSRHAHTGLQRTLQHPVDKHTHLSFYFAEGRAAHYRDIRKFGKWRLVAPRELDAILGELGPDPLTESWRLADFRGQVRASQRAIKAILLDQGVVAGVGNIYADEALFVAGIRPHTPGHKLSAARLGRLYQAVREVLQKGLEQGGTSLSDYVDGDGQPGRNQESLQAYGRYGLPCLQCGTVMGKTQVAQRTTTWCSRCQR